ncbi:DUF4260 domain-containing protein [Croceiramulus getboli]|nr:DUF4260 domain-containing protein [Flavobacteriaceae bacterium YJPT1-3]
MKIILKLEELSQLGLGIYLFSLTGWSWWWFAGLFLLPDIGILGYAINAAVGAHTYNFFHHKGLALVLFLMGRVLLNPVLEICGIILFAHAAFDRALGYGLKYERGFQYTHLGHLEKLAQQENETTGT